MRHTNEVIHLSLPGSNLVGMAEPCDPSTLTWTGLGQFLLKCPMKESVLGLLSDVRVKFAIFG